MKALVRTQYCCLSTSPERTVDCITFPDHGLPRCCKLRDTYSLYKQKDLPSLGNLGKFWYEQLPVYELISAFSMILFYAFIWGFIVEKITSRY